MSTTQGHLTRNDSKYQIHCSSHSLPEAGEDWEQRKTEEVEVRKWQCLAAGDEAVQTPDRGTRMTLGVHSNGLQRGVCRIPPRIGLPLLLMEQDHSHTGRLSHGSPPLPLPLPLLPLLLPCFVVFLFSVPVSYW